MLQYGYVAREKHTMRYWNLKVNTATFIWKQYLIVTFNGTKIKKVINKKPIRYLLLITPGLCDWLFSRNVWVWDGLELPGSCTETLMVFMETWWRDSYHTFILPIAFLPMYTNETIAAVMTMTSPTLKLLKKGKNDTFLLSKLQNVVYRS